MKKTILLFLLLPTMMVSNAQYTLVPDPNFENFLENNGMGDGVSGNGQVLTANIENVIDLILPFNGDITDITGIEDFISLEYLDASFNSIINVDFSQNIQLKTLIFAFNPLSQLDLSLNVDLEYLNCQSNQLTNLYLNSDKLTTIYCFENFLTEIDLTNLPLLIELNCNDNQISELDLSQNPLLQLLSCASNNLTSLYTTNNPDLFYLLCGRNNIESLDLSQNPELTLLLAPFMPPLNHLDMRNGNNQNIGSFNIFGTDSLKCVFVDDATANYFYDWYKDPFTTFVNNEAECDALSVPSFEKEKLLMYPNPTTGIITVSYSKPAEFNITDINGKILKTGKLNLGLSRITIEEFSAGLYFFKVKTDSGTITKKLLKQ